VGGKKSRDGGRGGKKGRRSEGEGAGKGGGGGGWSGAGGARARRRDARGIGEKDAGAAGKGAAPATNFRARGHCGAGAWPRRRSKRKIDAVRGGRKAARARARARACARGRAGARVPRRRPGGGKKMQGGGKKKGRTAKRAGKREENARGGRAKRTILRHGVALARNNPLSRKSSPLFLSPRVVLFPSIFPRRADTLSVWPGALSPCARG